MNRLRTFWQQRPLVVILFVSVLARVAAALYMGNTVVDLPGIADQISYHTLATRLLGGFGYTFDKVWWPVTRAGEPTAHWSYLYSFYLTAVYRLFGIWPVIARLIQAAVVGVLHPWLAYRIGRRLFGRTAGLAAAGITAVYLYFVYYSAALMTEAFYITGILGVLELSLALVKETDRDRMVKMGLALGFCLGAVLLLRQVFLLVVPFIFGWVFLASRRKSWFGLLLSGAVVAAMIAPITLFNYRQFDRFVLLNTNAGYAFFWGNHPIYGTHFVGILPERGAYQRLIPQELRGLDEAALDQALLRRGIDFVLDDPLRYILLSLSRIPVYFEFLPAARSSVLSNLSRVGSFGIFLPFMLAGLWRGFPRRWDDPGVLLLLFALVYTGAHLMTWALIRYRLPVDAVLVMYAGKALVDLREWRRRSARAGPQPVLE